MRGKAVWGEEARPPWLGGPGALPGMDGRHRFLAVVANDAFGLGNPNTVEATMSEHVELFEEFFKPTTTQQTVFFAYQPRLVEDDLGKLVRAQRPRLLHPLAAKR